MYRRWWGGMEGGCKQAISFQPSVILYKLHLGKDGSDQQNLGMLDV